MSSEKVTTDTFRVSAGFGGTNREELIANFNRALETLETAATAAGHILAWDTVNVRSETDVIEESSICGESELSSATYLIAQGVGVRVIRG